MKNVWFEVRESTMSKIFHSSDEAREYLKDMNKGFPSSKKMNEQDRNYWKHVSKAARIFRVTQTAEVIK